MKNWTIVFFVLLAISCQNGKTDVTEEKSKEQTTKEQEPMPEGLRNKRGYPIGTVEQATQLLAGAQAKRGEIARRMADMIKNPKYTETIMAVSKDMERVRPKVDRFDDITKKIVAGERVDFLSDNDLATIEYRQQTLLDALIDSLSYLNSELDQSLGLTDELLMQESE